jgi:hypothetical protein
MSDDIMSSYDLLDKNQGLGDLFETENGWPQRFTGFDLLKEFVDQTNGGEVIGLPDGKLEIYIQSNDSIHITNLNGEKINGIDSEIPNLENTFKRFVTKDGETTIVDATIGAEAEKFIAYIDLNPNSPTFGKFDTEFGFKNVAIWHPQWSGVGRYRGDGWTGAGKEYNINAYDAIMSHPNYKVAVLTQLFQLDQYADTYNLDKEVLVEQLRANNPELADVYERIAEKDLTHEGFLENGYNFDTLIENKDLSNTVGIGNTEAANVAIGVSEFTELADDVGSDNNITFTDGERDYNPLDVAIEQIYGKDDEKFIKSFGAEEFGFVSLKYPHDAVYGSEGTEGGQDHIILEQFSYKPPQRDNMKDHVDQTNRDSTYLSGVSRNSVLRTFLGMVKMPIPNNLSFSNGVAWGDGRANPLEMAAFMSTQNSIRQAVMDGNFGGAFSSIGGDIKAVLNDIKKGKVSGPTGEAISAVISQFALSRVGIQVDANQMLARTVGTVINPNLELLFNGPKLRNFVFSFNFAPNDELDASVMRRIQRFFKQGMAPGRSLENRIFLGSPNIFRIRYRTNEGQRIKGLPLHKICALTTCEINYAPDGVYQSYEDASAGSSPVRTIMNLNFTELTPIFRGDYLNELEPGIKEGSDFSDEFGSPKGEGGFEPISLEDTGF